MTLPSASDATTGATTRAARRRGRIRLWRRMLAALLVLWALGLVVAGVRVAHWQRETSQLLLQLRADALLRASALRAQEQVQAQWYRQRALALLTVIEQQRGDAAWSLFIPGAWPVFDNLRQDAAKRIGREFGLVVVQTLRRELDARTAALTGMPSQLAEQRPQSANCAVPGAPAAPPTLAVEQTGEYLAMVRFVDAAAQLDDALIALQALQGGAAQPDDLRRLVRLTLGAEISGDASRALLLFHTPDLADSTALRSLEGRMRMSMRCGLDRGMQALHLRLVEHNPLLASQQALLRAGPAGSWFDLPSAGTPARLRALHATLNEQDAMLASGSHAWLRSSSEQQLDPAYAALLESISRIRLFDPQDALRLQAQAMQGQTALRTRLHTVLAPPGSGVDWQAATGRFVFAPERRALSEGLNALLREPFMAEAAAPPVPAQGQPAAWSSARRYRVEDVVALPAQRRRFTHGTLTRFPVSLRPAVLRYVDERIAQLAIERGRSFVQTAAATSDGMSSSDDLPHARLALLDAALQQAGAPALAARVRESIALALPATQVMGAGGELVIIDVPPTPTPTPAPR